MFKVVINYKYYSFEKYSDALRFKNKNGGTLYQKICTYGL